LREERGRDSSGAEADKIRVAIAQLDCADLYLAAAVNLELKDPDLRRLLDDLRRDALWVRDELSRLRVFR
jgi:hypothetical protein